MAKRFLLLMGLATLMLPVHHSTSFALSAMFLWTDRYRAVEAPNYDALGSFAFYVQVLIQQIDYFALPAFMFVSGFFAAFAAGKSAKMQWSTVKSRVWQLLVPFCIWSFIFFLLFARRVPEGLDELLDRYYYIPLVIQYYLLSLILMPVAKKRPMTLLLIAAALELGRFTLHLHSRLGYSFAGADLLQMLTPRWLFPNLFFWFAFGAVAGFHRRALTDFLQRKNVKWVLLAATIALAVLMMVEYQVFWQLTGETYLGAYFGGYTRYFYALAFILTFLAFDKWQMPLSSQLTNLGAKSLGVYLLHSRIMYVAAVLLYRYLPAVLGHVFIYQGILIVVSLLGSLSIMELVRRTPARRYYKYLFG